MAAGAPLEFFSRSVEGLGAAALLALMLWRLVDCFLGYVIFRLVLVVTGLVAGAFIGAALVSWRSPSASGAEYFLGCLVTSGLLALAAWYLYRVAFAAGLAAAVAALVASAGSHASVGWWILGGVVGAALGVVAYVHLRRVFIFVSGVSGGFGAVFCAGSVVAGGSERFLAAATGPAGPMWLTVVVVGVAAALSVAGMYSQARLARVVQTSLMPQDRPRRRRGDRGPGLAERAAGRL